MGSVYENGFNIGHCGLTSRYVAISNPDAELYYGVFPALAGTKSSKNGEHAWTVIDDYVVDTTLMIAIPVQIAIALGYEFKRKIDHECARILPEYDSYSNEVIAKQKEEAKKREKDKNLQKRLIPLRIAYCTR